MPSREIPDFVPTVGRSALYWPIGLEKAWVHTQPFHALILHVNPDGTVNLMIYNEVGVAHPRQQVPFPLNRRPQSGEASFPA